MTIKDLIDAMKYSEEIKIIRLFYNDLHEQSEKGLFRGFADEVPSAYGDMKVDTFCIDREDKLAKKITIYTWDEAPRIKGRKPFNE